MTVCYDGLMPLNICPAEKQRSRPWYDSQPFLDGDMNRWKIIRSVQDKYAFICMFRTDKAKECQAKQESQFMMSLCQGVSSFNVSMLTSSSDGAISGMSQNFRRPSISQVVHLSSLSSQHLNEGNLGSLICFSRMLVCLFMVWDNLLRNLMCLCHKHNPISHQTIPPRLSLCPVCMSSPKYGFVLLLSEKILEWVPARQLLFNLAFYYEFSNNNEDVPNKIRIWKTRRFSEIVFRHICI